MDYYWQFEAVRRNADLLLRGATTTLLLTLTSVVAGFLAALVLLLLRRTAAAPVRWTIRAYVDLFRGLPVLVLMVWLFFCLPILLDIRISGFWVAVLSLALNYSALEAEILRAGVDAIPGGQLEVTRHFRFTPWQTARHVIVPQAFWRTLAPSLGQAINTLKLSALASFIAVPDLFYVTEGLVRDTFRPLEFYTALAAAYLVLILPLSAAVQVLENRLTKRFRAYV